MLTIKRPFRLYNNTTKKFLRGRNYKIYKNCHVGALVEARWADVGTSITVIDKTTESLRGRYTRTTTSVKFMEVR